MGVRVCGCVGVWVKCRLSVGAVTALERLDRDRMMSAVARQTRTDEVCVRVCARVCMCVVETRDAVRRRSGLDFLSFVSFSLRL